MEENSSINYPSVAVIGGGSWASAIVKMLTNNLDTVNWWVRKPESVNYIKKYRHNPDYLQSVEYDISKLNISSDLTEIVQKSDVLIIAVPSAYCHETVKDLDVPGLADKKIVSAIKGVIPEFDAIPAKYFHKQFGTPYENIAMICGPCHAEEVGMERLSYLTIAGDDLDFCEVVASMVRCRYIKAHVNNDLVGAEVSAILKNIYAVAAGIFSGLGYGDNFQAVLVSNGIQEAKNFIDAVYPLERDLDGSAYLGDLLVTAYSRFSRNRTFGFMVGKGYSVKTAQLEMEMVAEGYYAVAGIMEMNKKYNVDLPIVQAVYHIIYERISPHVEMSILADKLK